MIIIYWLFRRTTKFQCVCTGIQVQVGSMNKIYVYSCFQQLYRYRYIHGYCELCLEMWQRAYSYILVVLKRYLGGGGVFQSIWSGVMIKFRTHVPLQEELVTGNKMDASTMGNENSTLWSVNATISAPLGSWWWVRDLYLHLRRWWWHKSTNIPFLNCRTLIQLNVTLVLHQMPTGLTVQVRARYMYVRTVAEIGGKVPNYQCNCRRVCYSVHVCGFCASQVCIRWVVWVFVAVVYDCIYITNQQWGHSCVDMYRLLLWVAIWWWKSFKCFSLQYSHSTTRGAQCATRGPTINLREYFWLLWGRGGQRISSPLHLDWSRQGQS